MTDGQLEHDRTLGKYRVIRRLGAGAYGTVVEAIDTELGRKVALKLLAASLMRDPDFVRKYLQEEARSLARLRHPSIVQIFDIGRGDGLTFLVLEYIDGETLDQWAKNRTPSLPELLRVIEQIADALDYAHGRGVVHRDVKPSNILVDRNGNPHLTDFGLAHAAMTTIGSTSTRMALGTAAYMSPEQAEGIDCDVRSDVYSFGVVVYELITGHTPFKESTILGYIRAHADRPPPPPVEFSRGISQDIQDVILQVLQKSPEQRFQSAGEFAQALIKATQMPYRRATVEGASSAGDARPQELTSEVPAQKQERKRVSTARRLFWTVGALIMVVVCVVALVFGTQFAGLWGTSELFVTSQPTSSTAVGVPLATPTGSLVQSFTPELSPTALPEATVALPMPTSPIMPTLTKAAAPQPTNPPIHAATAQPTAPEAGPAPTFTTAASPTLPPTSTILFQDDFSDPASGWGLERNDRIQYKNGELVLKDTGSFFSEGVWTRPHLTFDNFVLTVFGRWSGGAEGGRYGVRFRYDDDADYYGFFVGNDGLYEIGKRTDDGWSVLLQGYSDATSPKGDPNLFQIEANGAELSFYFNGETLGSVEDTDHELGDILLGATKPDEADFFEASFDNVVVSKYPYAVLTPSPIAPNPPTDPQQLEVLLDEDFSWEPAGWSSGQAAFENGELVLNVEGMWSNDAWASPDGTFDDFILQVDGRWCDGAVGGFYGVRFRYENADDFYAYYVYNDGRYSIGKTANRAWSVLLEGFSEAIDRTGGVNRLHVEANGHDLAFFVNDHFLGSIRDVEHDLGSVILRARKPENTNMFQACFDNLIVARHP